MRILYFSRDYTTHDHRFLSALGETEHRIFYLRLEQRGYALEDRPLPSQVEHVVWPGGQGLVTLRDGPRLLAGLNRAIRHVKPDLILAGPLQRSAFLVALTGFRPLVSMSWGYDLLFDASRDRWWAWATRFTLQRSAVMIGDCNTIRKLAITYGIPEERVVTFPWGVDLAHFSPGELPQISAMKNRDNTPFTLLSTRGWEPIYGVDVIARAFAQVAQKNPHLHLVMLGNGSQAMMLRQVFLSAGVEEQVFSPGQVSYKDLPGYYRSADLYLSASHSDGTSISLLEALACGKPALVSDIPGNREWITPGENGWWFSDGNVSELAQGIQYVAIDRARLGQMSQAARQTAEQRADWKINLQQLLKAFDLAMQVTGA
jgi:glycosyltransferase involved in cell wall biosynthesis